MAIVAGAAGLAQEKPLVPGAVLEPVAFEALAGWPVDGHDQAFATFLRTCGAPASLREALPVPAILQPVCDSAMALAGAGPVDSAAARRFFETRFQAWAVRPVSGSGFLTGYFEPEFPGALRQSAEYPTPVYGRPPDLVTRGKADVWPELDPGLSAARQTPQGLVPHFDRGQIDDGALAGQGLEILWLKDAVDRFVMQVQGSSRIRLPDGKSVRLAYAGRNGFPYTSLGRTLTEEEGIPPAEMTMDRLVARLKSDIGKGSKGGDNKGLALIRRNRSFVFFRIAGELNEADGPIGGAGVPLTPHRSIAADRTLWPYGLPVWLQGEIPASSSSTRPLARLAVIQDTGSAILGPSRFDLYFGSGPEAGDLAGRVRHPVAATVLWPRKGP